MRVWLLSALCLASLSPAAENAPAPPAEKHKQGAKVPESLVQSKAPGHMDYTTDIKKLQAMINLKREENYQEAQEVWNEVKAQMDEQYNPSLLTIAADKETVQQEATTVTDTETQTVQAAKNAKDRAELEKFTLEDNAKKSAALVSEVKQFVQSTTAMMRQATEMVLVTDNGAFKGELQGVKAKEDAKVEQLEGKLHAEKLKENADNQKTQTAFGIFKAKTEAKSKAATEAINGAKKEIADIKKSLKNFVGDIEDSVGKAEKEIKKIPQGDDVITTKDFDKMVKDAEEHVSDAIEGTYDAVGDKFQQIESAITTDYQAVSREASRTGTEMAKEVNDLINEDDKNMEAKAAEAKTIGRMSNELANNAQGSTAQMEQDVTDFSTKVSEAEQVENNDLKLMEDEQVAAVGGQLEKQQDTIDKTSNVLDNEITDAASETSEAVTAKVQELDEQVQKAIMSGAGEEASMQSTINGERNAAKQLAAQSSTVSASIMTETKAADKLLEEAKEAAAKNQFEMQLEKGQLDQNLKLGVQKYQVSSEGLINKLAADVAGYVPWIEGQTWPKLNQALHYIADYLAQQKSVQTEDLAKLQNQLKTVQENLRRFGSEDQVTSVEVPQLIASAETDLMAMETWLKTLGKDRNRTKAQVEQTIAVKVQDGKNWVNKELEDIRRGVRNSMSDMQRQFLTEVSKNTGDLKKVEGENLANQQEIENTQQYMEQKMDELTTSLDNEATILASSQEYVNAQLNEMNGPKLAQLHFVGSTQTQAAAAEMQKAEDKAKQEEADALADNEQRLNSGLSDKSDKAQAAIAELGAGGIKSLQETSSNLQQEIRDAEASAQSSGLAATKASQEFETSSRDLQREGAALTLKAEALQQSAELNEKRLEEKAAGLNSGVLQDAKSNVESAERQIAAAYKRRYDSVMGQLDQVAAGSEGDLGKQEQAIRMKNQEVDTERQEVNRAMESANTGLKNVEENFEKAEGDLENELGAVQRSEKRAKEEANDETENLEQYSEGTVERSQAVLTAMGQEADDLMTQMEEGAGKIMDNTTAQAEYIEAGNVAAYSGVDTAIANAAAAEGTAEKNMGRAEQSLFKIAEQLDNHRLRFENFTQMKISNFRKRVEEEKDQLQSNLEYLDKYDRFTHQKELDLIGSTVELLARQAKQSDKAFDAMEMEEFKLAQSVGELMGSEEFQTLKKIMDTDSYVQEVTVDNDNLVNYLRITEEQNIPWMKKVLEALGQAHEDMLAEQDKNAAEQQEAEAKTAEKTNAAVKFLEQKATGSAQLPLGELKNMTTKAVKLLNGEAKDEADRSQRKFDELDSENMNLDNAMEQQYQTDKARFESTRGEVDNITGVVDSMTSKVQKLLDYNAKVVEVERQRLNTLAGNLSDQIFYSSMGGVEGAQQPASLAQTPGKGKSLVELDSLLKQNQKLSTLNMALSKKHEELGKEVVDQLRKHKVVVPGIPLS